MQYQGGASVAEGMTMERCACRCDSAEESHGDRSSSGDDGEDDRGQLSPEEAH